MRNHKNPDYNILGLPDYDPVVAEQAMRDYRENPSIENRNRVVVANIKLAAIVASKFERFGNSGLGVDELFSFASQSLIRAVELYDPNRNAKLSTYIVRSCELRVYRHATYARQDRARRKSLDTHFGDNGGFDVEDRSASSEVNHSARDFYRKMVRYVAANLSRRHAYALIAKTRGRPLTNIAERLGVSKQRASQLYERSVKEIKKIALGGKLK